MERQNRARHQTNFAQKIASHSHRKNSRFMIQIEGIHTSNGESTLQADSVRFFLCSAVSPSSSSSQFVFFAGRPEQKQIWVAKIRFFDFPFVPSRLAASNGLGFCMTHLFLPEEFFFLRIDSGVRSYRFYGLDRDFTAIPQSASFLWDRARVGSSKA